MADGDDIRARLVEIESALAHQDATLRELSDNAAAQWKAIDALTRRVEALTDRLASVEEGSAADTDGAPPHY